MTTVEGFLMYPIPLLSSPLKKKYSADIIPYKNSFLNPTGLPGISASHWSSPNHIRIACGLTISSVHS